MRADNYLTNRSSLRDLRWVGGISSLQTGRRYASNMRDETNCSLCCWISRYHHPESHRDDLFVVKTTQRSTPESHRDDLFVVKTTQRSTPESHRDDLFVGKVLYPTVINAYNMIPQSQLSIIPNTGHVVFMENFAAVWASIVPFLKE